MREQREEKVYRLARPVRKGLLRLVFSRFLIIFLLLVVQVALLVGGFHRLEALGTAAWVLSDVTLLGLAALAGREMAGGRDRALIPPLAAAFLGGCLLPNAAVEGVATFLFGANLLLGAALPVALSLLPLGRKGHSGGISCG